MKIRFRRSGLWWSALLVRKDGELSQYSFVWPLVYLWLKDRLEDDDGARLIHWIMWKVL